ncbi:MAG TPA: mersacidin/lichenicidin family type 2 lantibiotic [Thermoanaerobaculia bacterium]|nr:mersacidin/lichenicidin family type 2 lantibiotic [Thermoanaerobaculia bacterium]
MKKVDIIRAWKDPAYRAALSPDELAQLPSHPSGILELQEEQLKDVSGAPLTIATAYTYANWRRCCP